LNCECLESREEGPPPAQLENLPSNEIGSYVHELARGVRRFTRSRKRSELRFLDHLLELVEQEAQRVAEETGDEPPAFGSGRRRP